MVTTEAPTCPVCEKRPVMGYTTYDPVTRGSNGVLWAGTCGITCRAARQLKVLQRRTWVAKFDGECVVCGTKILAGLHQIVRITEGYAHEECAG